MQPTFKIGDKAVYRNHGVAVITGIETIEMYGSLQNVYVLEVMDSLGYERGKIQLVLNRSNAYTGINVDNAESALGRKIDYQIINEYRGAISALNSGEPFMASRPDGPLGQSVSKFAREMDTIFAEEAVPARA